jgi:hypothetical protein
MLRISIEFDGAQFSKGAFQFAAQLNELKPVILCGYFLRQSDFASLWNPMPMLAVSDVSGKDEQQLLKSSREKFQSFCREKNIHFCIEDESDTNGYHGLEIQSRFSDALIVGSETFFSNVNSEVPNEYLKELLHLAECPVVVVPESSGFPEEIVLLYDGTASSVYAIKQFAQLFPELCGYPATLLYCSRKEETIPDHQHIKALAACHFDNLGLMNLHGPGGKSMNEWVQERKNPLVVSGAFARSDVSEMIKKSFVTEIIRDGNAILFVAHK